MDMLDPSEMARIFRRFMTTRQLIVKNPPPVAAPVKRAPVRKPVPKKAKEPYVLTITLLHHPDETGQDVLFASTGFCPADIDPDELEQYIADFFGGECEDETEYADEEEEEYE
jgi:hypothetical protein